MVVGNWQTPVGGGVASALFLSGEGYLYIVPIWGNGAYTVSIRWLHCCYSYLTRGICSYQGRGLYTLFPLCEGYTR